MAIPKKVDVIDADGKVSTVLLSHFQVTSIDQRQEASADMVRWGAGLGHAVHLLEMEEAAFKRWRAEVAVKALNTDPKLAEWKATKAAEVLPDYVTMKGRIAEAKRMVSTMESVYEAARMKAGTLKGLTDREPGDRAAAAIATSSPEAGTDSRVARMRADLSKSRS